GLAAAGPRPAPLRFGRALGPGDRRAGGVVRGHRPAARGRRYGRPARAGGADGHGAAGDPGAGDHGRAGHFSRKTLTRMSAMPMRAAPAMRPAQIGSWVSTQSVWPVLSL